MTKKRSLFAGYLIYFFILFPVIFFVALYYLIQSLWEFKENIGFWLDQNSYGVIIYYLYMAVFSMVVIAQNVRCVKLFFQRKQKFPDVFMKFLSFLMAILGFTIFYRWYFLAESINLVSKEVGIWIGFIGQFGIFYLHYLNTQKRPLQTFVKG